MGASSGSAGPWQQLVDLDRILAGSVRTRAPSSTADGAAVSPRAAELCGSVRRNLPGLRYWASAHRADGGIGAAGLLAAARGLRLELGARTGTDAVADRAVAALRARPRVTGTAAALSLLSGSRPEARFVRALLRPIPQKRRSQFNEQGKATAAAAPGGATEGR